MVDQFNFFREAVEDLNIHGLNIQVDYPSIVMEGPRMDLMDAFKEILDWERDVNYKSRLLDQFEIAMDLEAGYISFFMKPINHA